MLLGERLIAFRDSASRARVLLPLDQKHAAVGARSKSIMLTGPILSRSRTRFGIVT